MLDVSHITLQFGGLIAVNDVSMKIEDGKITGLIGPNGAGKTTTFNCLSGVYTPNKGSIVFNGEHLEGLRPHKIHDKGISRTYQIINLFRTMSVIDNVMIGIHGNLKSNFLSSLLHTRAERAEERAAYEKAYELLKFVGLEGKAKAPAGSLSYGEQRLLEIVRGLANDPKLLLLDEPAAGMNSKEKEDLNILLKKILDQGVGILMVEHDMKMVMDVCDYIYVLCYGKLLAEGVPEEVRNNPEVIAAYLGGDD